MKSMQHITHEKSNALLSGLGLRIGSWNQVEDLSGRKSTDQNSYVVFKAPTSARSLYVFSEHVAGWLPSGDWKLVQVDNSTSLDFVQSTQISCLLGGDSQPDSQNGINQASLEFSFGRNMIENVSTELLICNLIFMFLLFQCHVQIVSSSCTGGQFISIQDGFVYFMFGSESLKDRSAKLMSCFEKAPLASPKWINEIVDQFGKP
jgi:hypothetical protein